jgi:hypothetical protein
MQPERFAPNNPREWLVRARSNLIRARMQASGVLLEDLIAAAEYHQAVEIAERAVKWAAGQIYGEAPDPISTSHS